MNKDVSPITLLVDEAKRESLETFRADMERAMLFPEKRAIRRHAIETAMKRDLKDGLYVEFGVAAGHGCRLFGRRLKKVDRTLYGFDSFEGLEEDWTGMHTGRAAGAFDQAGKLPEVPPNVTLIEGWVQDTLPPFLKETGKAPFSFIHMDMDTYTPTLFALNAVKKRLRKGTVILFDELYGYPGWKHHEYKALQEVLDPKSYRFLSFSREEVAIEMI